MQENEIKQKVVDCFLKHIEAFSDEVASKYGFSGGLEYTLDIRNEVTHLTIREGYSTICQRPECWKN